MFSILASETKAWYSRLLAQPPNKAFGSRLDHRSTIHSKPLSEASHGTILQKQTRLDAGGWLVRTAGNLCMCRHSAAGDNTKMWHSDTKECCLQLVVPPSVVFVVVSIEFLNHVEKNDGLVGTVPVAAVCNRQKLDQSIHAAQKLLCVSVCVLYT